VAQPGDPVVEQPPARTQQARELRRVDVDLRLPHVLDHPDRGDRVEALAHEIAVVEHADVDPVADAGRLCAAASQHRLGLRQGDADDLDAVTGRGVERKAPPAAADVEHTIARLQRQLLADQLELLLLRLLQRLRAAGEERAAVGHRLVEEQREEVVRHVVVVADGARVALLVVAATARDELRGGAPRREREAAGPQRRESEPRSRAGVRHGRAPALEDPHDAVDVVELEVTGGVGAPKAELPGRAERVGDGGRRTDDERRRTAIPLARRQLAAVPEHDVEGACRKRALDLPAEWPCAGKGHSATLAPTST
jgi:hypothetical protein